ncbi:nascent polypeptide-associated complex subunit alpha, muscle-specific form-like [Lynx canadensis]|uniref:nascent polypeptide-associated complex subunit alpha, muscle-specific form-like n=1 Tax=Lynx canadensis TaxID=61383 RepID=UPI0011B0C0A8|nr:nascent polypeptide-associated complex subunit alpha, muscle-specific form-like [Lynx canadensis]
MKTKKVKLAQRLPSNLCSQQGQEGGKAHAASSVWPPRGWQRPAWPSGASVSGVFYFWTQPPGLSAGLPEPSLTPASPHSTDPHGCRWGPAKCRGPAGQKLEHFIVSTPSLPRPAFSLDLWPHAGPGTPRAVASSPQTGRAGSSPPQAETIAATLTWLAPDGTPTVRHRLNREFTPQATPAGLSPDPAEGGCGKPLQAAVHCSPPVRTPRHRAQCLVSPPPQPQTSAFPPPAHIPWRGSGLLGGGRDTPFDSSWHG